MKHLANGLRVLVADGSHARVFRNEGDALHPKLVLVRVYDQDNPPTHEQGTQRPNRGIDGSGHRTALDETDFHRQAEDRFIQRVALDMERDLSQGGYEKAVVVAPPIALGTFRKAASPAVTKTIVLELHKDLTKHNIPEITKTVAAALEEA
jgi:protein required for attachment to host cells